MAKNPNTQYYETFRAVPKEAQKTINGGRLNGFTDINPMWRIKSLTEVFGPAGIGWYTEEVERWSEASGQEKAVFVKVNLYIKADGEWSKPIVGIGGSKVLTNERSGQYLNDEAYKMAYTDALSICCKALGMGADIYYSKDCKSTDNRTKYDLGGGEPAAPARRQPAPAPQPEPREDLTYKPLANEVYWKLVECYARGVQMKSGVDAKRKFIMSTHAGQKEIDKFLLDVQDYKANLEEGTIQPTETK